jgi:uncharacterized MAPEG superfamily protein
MPAGDMAEYGGAVTTPFYCVAAVFALIWVPRIFVLRAQIAQPGGLDNRYPRDQQTKLVGLGRRANAAHANTFEAFAPFAAAVVIAHLSGASSRWSAILALAFVAFRCVYVAAYLGDVPTLRSAAWLLGLGATTALQLLGACVGGCERHVVEIEGPSSGRALAPAEEEELQRVADGAFREARSLLEDLPPRLTLIVKFGKDHVIPETGETGSAAYPGNVGLTLDPDRDVLFTIRTHVRACLLHELHHLARRSRVPNPVSLRDRLIFEGLATAFERDTAKNAPPWGEVTPEVAEWAREVLQLPENAETEPWFVPRADGRRFVGSRVGTFLVDRASKASTRPAARLVSAPTAEVLALAGFP